AGFDLLMLNMAHGYLLASFLSPLTNTRADYYGGSQEYRQRFPLEVFDSVRAVWPQTKPLAVALGADDWTDGGLTVDDAAQIALVLKAHGCDLILPLAGQTIPDDKPTYGPNFLARYAELLHSDTGIMTMTTGGITTTSQVNSILAAGSADLCIM